MSLRPRRAPTEVMVTSVSPVTESPTPGPGCGYATAPPAPPEPIYKPLRCPLPADGKLPRVRISLGDGLEEAAYVDERLWALIYGGPGSDQIQASGDLFGGPGTDSISAIGSASRLSGGPGDDQIRAGPGADTIDPGPGRDRVWLANEHRGETAWKDTRRDEVSSRDGELDQINCDTRGPADLLKLDGLDWPADPATARWPAYPGWGCEKVLRSSPPLPLPAGIDSPNYEVSEGTQVWVFCPGDGRPLCEGVITLRIAGRSFGPVPFRVRAERQRAFHLTNREFGWGEDTVAASITLRVRRPRGFVHVRDTLLVGPTPYDSS